MIGTALGWLYPDRCALCAVVGHNAVCPECQNDLQPSGPATWDTPPLAFRAGVYRYQGRAAQAVRRLKYVRSTALAGFMAEALAPRIQELACTEDLVVPVPIHWRRRGDRGFNQSDLLCGGSHGRMVEKRVLRRVRMTPPQASLPVAARGENLHGAFTADPTFAQDRRILLIDDVLTTGHTARACAQALLDAGAHEVGVLAFAMAAPTAA